MKTIIFCITVIIAEVFGYGYLCGVENAEQKYANEISELRHNLVMADVKNSKLQRSVAIAATLVTEEEWENIRNN